MKSICVGGLSSECGKTSVVCLLLKALPGWAAIKVVPSELNAKCRRGRTCEACQPPDRLYEITREADPAGAKDTSKFLRAGAASAYLVRALPKCLAAAIRAAVSKTTGVPGVLIESTSAMPLVEGVRIMVARPGSAEIKSSASRAAKYVDLVVINEPEDAPGVEVVLPAELAHIPRVRSCAALPGDDPRNREFVEQCRRLLEDADGFGIAETGQGA